MDGNHPGVNQARQDLRLGEETPARGGNVAQPFAQLLDRQPAPVYTSRNDNNLSQGFTQGG